MFQTASWCRSMPGCKWKPKWQNKFSWACPVKRNPKRVFCTVCGSDFSCDHGSAELKRHEGNSKHRSNLERKKVVDAGTRTLSITESFKKAEEISSEQKKIKDAALIAEASISNLIATHNVPRSLIICLAEIAGAPP